MHKINIIFLLLVVCPIFCMQKTQKKLTTFVQKPHLIAFLNKEKVFIGGENGFELINPTTDESITQECFEYQTNKKVYDFAINRSKTKFGITIEGEVIRYNAHTNEREWEENTSIKGYNSLTFNSQCENQIITHMTTSNAYGNIDTISPDLAVIPHLPGYYVHSPIHCRPTQTAVLFSNDDGILQEITCLSSRQGDRNLDIVFEGQYTPDGSRPLVHGYKRISLSDIVCLFSEHWTNNTQIIEHNIINDSDHFSLIAFYSESIIALLLSDTTIEYWNYKKKTLLATTPAIVQHKSTLHAEGPLGKRISFSPNGLHCAIATSNDCYIASVPIKIIFKRNTKQRLFPIFYLIYNSTLTLHGKDGTEITEFLPDEVVYLILEKLLLINKRVLI